ncbi:MAG: cytochrome P450 [Pseudomonadota bacterium]
MTSAPNMRKRPKGMSDLDYVELLRADGPALDPNGFLWCFSHEHLMACVDPRTTRQVELEKMAALGLTSGPVYDYFANALLFAKGAAHARRRGPLARAFAFPVMAAMRPKVREAAEALIRPHLGREVDFLNEIAGPLPARIVADIIGAPPDDVPMIASLVYEAMAALSRLSGDPAEEAALGALSGYVTSLIETRRDAPGDNFLARYADEAEVAGMTWEETTAQIVAVILAGSDTTRMALCSTFSCLLANPAQWAAFQADTEGLKTAVASEGLRFDPVVGSLPRVATSEVTLDDVTVEAGTVLAPSVIGALRDPAVYASPETFDVMRADHPRYHPVFGAGAHRCLGEALARIELEEALAALAALAPNAALIGDPPRLRGLSAARSIDRMEARL